MFMSFEVVAAPNKAKVSSLDELIMWQDDRFHIDQIVDLAKYLDKSIKKTADLHSIIGLNGFTVFRDGQRFLAVREVGAECSRCHRR